MTVIELLDRQQERINDLKKDLADLRAEVEEARERLERLIWGVK